MSGNPLVKTKLKKLKESVQAKDWATVEKIAGFVEHLLDVMGSSGESVLLTAALSDVLTFESGNYNAYIVQRYSTWCWRANSEPQASLFGAFVVQFGQARRGRKGVQAGHLRES